MSCVKKTEATAKKGFSYLEKKHIKCSHIEYIYIYIIYIYIYIYIYIIWNIKNIFVFKSICHD